MKIIAFDIDDVLCTRDKGIEHKGVDKYAFCRPITNNIEIVNSLYEKGFYIKLYTSRGMTSLSADLQQIESRIRPITERQMNEWNVKYHELIFGKTHFDVLIDDKTLNIDQVKSAADVINFVLK